MDDEGELTDRGRLIAKLVEVLDNFPGGYQVALGIRLNRSVEDVEELFTRHNLPLRDELVAELTLWRCHAEDGARLMERGYKLLRAVMQSVSDG